MSDRCGSSPAAVVAALMTIKMEDHILMVERWFAYGEYRLLQIFLSERPFSAI